MEFGPNGSSIKAASLWMSDFAEDQRRSAHASELAALVELAVTGDAAAFEQILLRTQKRVLNLAWRLVGSLTDAQDVAQETFLRAFKYLHRFDVRKPFEPWLIRIAVNVCRDVIRGRQHADGSIAEPDRVLAALATEDPSSDPHALLAGEQQRELLRRILLKLPEKERTALVLRDLEGFSTAEVAEILESSEATVRSQISSARLKIKKALKGVRP
jgi:RNA polymerase sigma-70 factor (ECF subfamily)